jgi:hypothetical protein
VLTERQAHMTEIQRIGKRDDLVALANKLGVLPDWHEPDNQEVTAEVRGKSFDNAGFWGIKHEVDFLARHGARGSEAVEMYVVLYQDGEPVAEVNLATLFAFATGYGER